MLGKLPDRVATPTERRSPHEEDLALARAVQARDPEALERFVRRMGCVPRMLRRQNGRLGSPLDPADVEDVVQDALIVVWRKLVLFEGRSTLETWVYRICRLELMNGIRRKRRRPDLMGDAERAPVAEAPHPLDDAEAALRGLDRLGPPSADVIRWKHLEALTFEEIARRLEVSSNTVKTWYYRGLCRLRDQLERDGGGRVSPPPPNDDHAAHRDRLERVLVSDLRPDSAEVLAWRAACGACARELDGLLRLGRTLDRAGREEQEDVRVATAENATAPVNEAVRARLLALAAAPAAAPAPAEAPSDERAAPEAPSPARPRRALVAAAAAAAVVALALAIRSFRADEGASELPADGPSGVRLGHGFEMAPEGVVREPFPFTWQVERPGGGAYVLRVFDPQGREVLPAVRLEEPRWVPDPSTRSALPPEFTWEVTVLSATGDPVAVDRRDVVVRP